MNGHEDIKAAVHAALDERDGLDRETHHADHVWVQTKRKREQLRDERRTAMYDKIKATVIGGMVILALTAVTTGLYNVGRFVIDLYQKSQSGN